MLYIGIDFGGTNIKAGVVDENGKIICKDMMPTGAGKSYGELASDVASLIHKILNENKIDIKEINSIGIGFPGTCDVLRGIVLLAENIGLHNAPFRDEMKKYFDIPIFIGNDANCAALGEYQSIEEDVENIVFITLGTGIGGGIIIDKKLYTGKNGTAAEVGHMPIETEGILCNCGMRGCWEKYASVSALIRMTKEYADANPQSALADECRQNGISGKTAFVLAKAGDNDGKYVVKKWIKYISAGIISIINLLQPEYIIVGGAISREGDYLLNPIKEEIGKNPFYHVEGKTKIIAARLGNDAGLIGAAFLGKGDNV